MIEFRRAGESDAEFIAESIREAEKSGTDVFSYARIFGLEDEKATEIIKNAVLEDIPGQELCLSGFIIADSDGEPAGAVCSWIEAEEDVPSSVIKANVLFYFLGKEIIAHAADKSVIVEPLTIQREQGTLQIESVYVRNKFRGMGVSNKLILEHIKQSILNGKSFSKVQIQLAETNASALASYKKLGFETMIRKTGNHPDILNYLPSDTKIMMELRVSELAEKGLI